MSRTNNGENNAGGQPFNPGVGAPGMPLPGYQAQPSFYPMQPGMPPMPSMFPNMMPPMPAMMGAPPMQTAYPPGQGPLADLPTTRGANGLIQAPEPEGPDAHEATEYMKLNPGETLKYSEFWAQASEGAETLSGKYAVAFLSRASKVSKGQLRRIWDVADHRKEGELDEAQFFVALRLVALAQRGAELSAAGLRNFTGIQLIPKIDPPPKPETPPPPPSQPEATNMSPTQQMPATDDAERRRTAAGQTFSWTIPLDIATRFDTFFQNLAPNGGDNLDSKTVVPFLTKSGLPRSTLKKIWQLADVNRDGKLSQNEFRIAMHLVTAIRNNRVTADELPAMLDASGPNWLRVAGEAGMVPPVPPPMPPAGPTSVSPQTPLQQATSPVPHMHEQSGDSSPIVPLPPPPPQAPPSADGLQPAIILAPPPPPPSQQQQQQQQLAEAPTQMQQPSAAYEAERKEREEMLAAMRKEREEMERARKEMEQMRSEMERMRMENAARAPATHAAAPPAPTAGYAGAASHQSQLPAAAPAAPAPQQSQQPQQQQAHFMPQTPTMPAAPPATHASNAMPAILAQRLGLPTGPAAATATATATLPAAATSGPNGMNAAGAPNPQTMATSNPIKTQPISLGGDEEDDDIWDQPSPKAGGIPAPGNNSLRQTQTATASNQDADSNSSDDDDDDFWGGMGPKPTLGAAGNRPAGGGGGNAGAGAGAGGASGTGFGGSELDDWVF